MRNLILLIAAAILLSCTKPKTNSLEIWDEFWTYVDTHYIYFEQKGVNWDDVNQTYRTRIDENTSELELFSYMEEALLLLKDNHNRLVSDFRYAKTYNFTLDEPSYFDIDLIKNYYIEDSLGHDGQLFWASISSNVGYIYLPSFNEYRKLSEVIRFFNQQSYEKIIIDLRNNGGGDSNMVPFHLGNWVSSPTQLGAYVEKAGPEHVNLSVPLPVYAVPSSTLQNKLPIKVLINSYCYSATSYCAAMMKGLPNVELIGQKTGGGGGGNLPFQLSNGWVVSVSVSDFIDKEGRSIELGVVPNIELNSDEASFLLGQDLILEYALQY